MVSLLLTLALAAAPLEEAKGLLAEARFEEVATVLAPLLSAPTAAPSERAEAEVLLGLAAHNLLDEKAASRAFTRAVALDAKVRLPPGASPRATALFNDAKAALPTAEAKVAASLVAPPPPAPAPLRPTRVAALVGGGLALALGVSGGVFTGVGLEGRAAAVAEPVGLLAAQRFDEASTAYLWGTGLLFAAAGTLLASTLLFLFPVAQ